MTEFLLIMPEILLALTLACVILGEVTYTGEEVRLVSAIAVLGLAGAFIQTLISYKFGSVQVFHRVLSIDGFSLFFKLLFIGLSLFSIFSVIQTREISTKQRSEFCALVIASALAMCLVASATDLVLAFTSLLFLNIVSYFLAAYGRRSMPSTEASVKYLAFGSVATALFLYAVAILFAYTRSLNVYDMHKALLQAPLPGTVMLVVFMLSFLALSFQFGAFPMYLLVPDVLEGAPTPVSGFLSMGTRAAGFAFTIRFFISVFAEPAGIPGQWKVLGDFDWTEATSVIAGLTMLVGALLSFRQPGAKRLVSYLVVVQTGFSLMGLVVLDRAGIAGILYNLVIELLALVGVYTILATFYDELQSDRLESLRGMLGKAVPECICLILFLLCLVGFPPLPGFIGKFALIGAAVNHQRFYLAIVGIVSVVISTVAVVRFSYYLVGDFRTFQTTAIAPSFSRKCFLGALIVPLFLTGIFADWVLGWANQSLSFIFW